MQSLRMSEGRPRAPGVGGAAGVLCSAREGRPGDDSSAPGWQEEAWASLVPETLVPRDNSGTRVHEIGDSSRTGDLQAALTVTCPPVPRLKNGTAT